MSRLLMSCTYDTLHAFGMHGMMHTESMSTKVVERLLGNLRGYPGNTVQLL